MPSLTIIILTVVALIFALSYNRINEFVTITGIGKPDIKPYEGKCRRIEGIVYLK